MVCVQGIKFIAAPASVCIWCATQAARHTFLQNIQRLIQKLQRGGGRGAPTAFLRASVLDVVSRETLRNAMRSGPEGGEFSDLPQLKTRVERIPPPFFGPSGQRWYSDGRSDRRWLALRSGVVGIPCIQASCPEISWTERKGRVCIYIHTFSGVRV